jgi:hypothetical protein
MNEYRVCEQWRRPEDHKENKWNLIYFIPAAREI